MFLDFFFLVVINRSAFQFLFFSFTYAGKSLRSSISTTNSNQMQYQNNMAESAITLPPSQTLHEATPLLTTSKLRGPFIHFNPSTASAYPSEAFLASITQDEHLQPLHVITYLRSNTHENSLPPDPWRYYLCAALARQHAFIPTSATSNRRPMSRAHRARYETFQEYFSFFLQEVIRKGDYGRPSTGKQEALIRFEEGLTRVAFNAWPELRQPCIRNNIRLLREMWDLVGKGFASVVMVKNPERPSEWVRRPDPAEWLMERTDRFHDGWIGYWPIAKANSDESGWGGHYSWKTIEGAKKEILNVCEEWVDHIESLQSTTSQGFLQKTSR